MSLQIHVPSVEFVVSSLMSEPGPPGEAGWGQEGWGWERAGRALPGHHFLLLLGAVGGEVLGNDVRVLKKHIANGLRTERGVRGLQPQGPWLPPPSTADIMVTMLHSVWGGHQDDCPSQMTTRRPRGDPCPRKDCFLYTNSFFFLIFIF